MLSTSACRSIDRRYFVLSGLNVQLTGNFSSLLSCYLPLLALPRCRVLTLMLRHSQREPRATSARRECFAPPCTLESPSFSYPFSFAAPQVLSCRFIFSSKSAFSPHPPASRFSRPMSKLIPKDGNRRGTNTPVTRSFKQASLLTTENQYMVSFCCARDWATLCQELS